MNSQLQQDLKYIHSNFKNKKVFKNKNVLITGFNGFIGYELSNYLIKYKKKLKINYLFLTDINFKKKILTIQKLYLKNMML